MKKKVIVFSVLAVIVAFVVMFLLCKPKYNYMVDFEENYVVENGVAPDELEYIIVLSEDGEYVMDAEWKIEPSGMLMALSIVDESGKDVNTFSAHWIDMNSGVMELPAGKYTMTLTPITSVEQWKEYFAKFDTSDWDEPVEEDEEPEMEFADGEYKFEFSFKLEERGKLDIQRMAVVFGAIFGVILVVIMVAVAQKDNSMKQNYDERQELLRGRGAKYGLYTMILLSFVLYLLEGAEVPIPLSAGMSGGFISFCGIGVYAVYCIWKDAYFALNHRVGVYIGIFVVGGLINLFIGIGACLAGTMIRDNRLSSQSLNLFCGILMLVVCVALILKKVSSDGEEA